MSDEICSYLVSSIGEFRNEYLSRNPKSIFPDRNGELKSGSKARDHACDTAGYLHNKGQRNVVYGVEWNRETLL